MTDSTITTIVVAFLAALPPTLTALAALRQSREAAQKSDDTNKKTEEMKADVKQIHALTNSTASELAKVLAVSQEKNAGLEKLVATLQEREKIDLAKQAMPPGHTPGLPDPTNGQTIEQVDEQATRIEKTGDKIHTRVKKIEKNTEIRDDEVDAQLDQKRDK